MKPDNLYDQINMALKALYLVPSPYEIRNGVRFVRGSDNLVSERLKIKVINCLLNKEYFFSSISECGKILELDRTKIKKSILTGEPYKDYKRLWRVKYIMKFNYVIPFLFSCYHVHFSNTGAQYRDIVAMVLFLCL